MRFTTIVSASLAAIVSLSSAAWSADDDKKDGENEQKITADQLPAVVKATLDQQTAGATVIKYEKETQDGKTVYTAEVKGKEKGQEIEYVVGEDGKLIATKVDTEDEGEKKEKKHHHKKDADK